MVVPLHLGPGVSSYNPFLVLLVSTSFISFVVYSFLEVRHILAYFHVQLPQLRIFLFTLLLDQLLYIGPVSDFFIF